MAAGASGPQSGASRPADGGGKAVAVWLGDGQDGDGNGVFGQRFSMDVILRDGFES
jgi:hypothetical protein